MIQQTPATAALGCGGSLILLGSFVSGFYLGNSQARGQVVDSNITNMLKYGPTALGGIYSIISANALFSVPGNLEEMMKNAPSNISHEQAEGCAKGCAPVISGIVGSVLMGAVTYAGYAVGHAMGK